MRLCSCTSYANPFEKRAPVVGEVAANAEIHNTSCFGNNKNLIQQEIEHKKVALRSTIPLALATLAVGMLAMYANPQQSSWSLHGPSWAVMIGLEYPVALFYSAFDNIQDEVAPLGEPQRRELIILAMGLLINTAALLQANKVYFVHAVSLLIGTGLASTNDKSWKSVALVGTGIVAIFGLLPSWNSSAPSEWIVWLNVAVSCLVSFFYQLLTHKRNPAGAPEWLVNFAHANGLHYVVTWVMALAGFLPLGWLRREVYQALVYYRAKLFLHKRCLDLVSSKGKAPVTK